MSLVSTAPLGGPGVRSPHDVACVIHVHSRYSDGTATVQELVDTARAAGVRVLLLTDHDSREAARRGLEGWHDDVLLLVGHEISPKGGHFLAFGVEEEIGHDGLTAADICREVTARGGFGFAAHPFSQGSRISRTIAPPHGWPALADCDCGIELWSLLTDTAERWRGPREAVRFMRRPELVADGPPAEHLAEWDRLCAVRRVPAIGGLDAHQPGVRVGRRLISPMPNARYFRMLRTHVLLDAPLSRLLEPDRNAVYGALREGRCYLALDSLAPADGFSFHAVTDEGAVTMGAETRAARASLHVRSPRRARLRLVADGRTVAEVEDERLEHDVDRPGAYRVEARLLAEGRERTWITSNPIYLRGAA